MVIRVLSSYHRLIAEDRVIIFKKKHHHHQGTFLFRVTIVNDGKSIAPIKNPEWLSLSERAFTT